MAVGKSQADPEWETSIIDRLTEAIRDRWLELASSSYTSVHRAIRDLTRDGEKILSEVGLEGVPPFPGSLKLGFGNGSSDAAQRLYCCTALSQTSGKKALRLHLLVSLATPGDGALLRELIPDCPAVMLHSGAERSNKE